MEQPSKRLRKSKSDEELNFGANSESWENPSRFWLTEQQPVIGKASFHCKMVAEVFSSVPSIVNVQGLKTGNLFSLYKTFIDVKLQIVNENVNVVSELEKIAMETILFPGLQHNSTIGSNELQEELVSTGLLEKRQHQDENVKFVDETIGEYFIAQFFINVLKDTGTFGERRWVESGFIDLLLGNALRVKYSKSNDEDMNAVAEFLHPSLAWFFNELLVDMDVHRDDLYGCKERLPSTKYYKPETFFHLQMASASMQLGNLNWFLNESYLCHSGEIRDFFPHLKHASLPWESLLRRAGNDKIFMEFCKLVENVTGERVDETLYEPVRMKQDNQWLPVSEE